MGLLDKLFGGDGGGRVSVSPQTMDFIKRDWEQIDIQVKGGTPSQLRQALISADKTLDTALKEKVSGEKMAERMQNAKDLFDYRLYDKLWKAHKMRNSLVHAPAVVGIRAGGVLLGAIGLGDDGAGRAAT